jgi:hypothetical protein
MSAPDEEIWTPGVGEVLKDAALDMIYAGMSQEVIENVLDTIVKAVKTAGVRNNLEVSSLNYRYCVSAEVNELVKNETQLEDWRRETKYLLGLSIEMMLCSGVGWQIAKGIFKKILLAMKIEYLKDDGR